MSNNDELLNNGKKIHVIVHGNRELYGKIKDILLGKKITKENIAMASLEKAGSIGEYVAMAWPPMGPKEVIISEITGTDAKDGMGMGAWAPVEQKELFRVPL